MELEREEVGIEEFGGRGASVPGLLRKGAAFWGRSGPWQCVAMGEAAGMEEREGGGGTWCAQEEDDAHQLPAGGRRTAHPHRTMGVAFCG